MNQELLQAWNANLEDLDRAVGFAAAVVQDLRRIRALLTELPLNKTNEVDGRLKDMLTAAKGHYRVFSEAAGDLRELQAEESRRWQASGREP